MACEKDRENRTRSWFIINLCIIRPFVAVVEALWCITSACLCGITLAASIYQPYQYGQWVPEEGGTPSNPIM